MNPFLATLGDPIWQILTVILVLTLPVGIMAVRTHDVHASADKKRQRTWALYPSGYCWRTLLRCSSMVKTNQATNRTRGMALLFSPRCSTYLFWHDMYH